MSLIAWYPLNGNTKNYGLGDCGDGTLRGSLPAAADGKIGKTYSWTSDSHAIQITDGMTHLKPLTKYSMACWALLTANGTYNGKSAFISSGNYNGSFMDFGIKDRQIITYPGSGCYTGHTLSTAIALNTWHHYAITCDGTKTYVYLDGAFVGSHSGHGITQSSETNNFYIGASTYYTGFTHKGKINDVRIYDHCLSPKEVKEISKGLILHYPMNEVDGAIGGRNLIKNGRGNIKKGFFSNFNTITDDYAEYTLTSKKQYSNVSIAAGFVLGCRDYNVGSKVVFSYDIMFTKWDFPAGATTSEWWMGQRYTNSSTAANDGSWWRTVTAHTLPKVGSNGVELNRWVHVDKVITIPAQAEASVGTASSIQFYNSNADVTASITFRLKNVKLTYGDTPQPWTPAPEDELVCGQDNIIQDASGYNNNGTVTSSTCPTWDSDAIVGMGSYKFDGSSDYIKTPLSVPGGTDMTFAAWVKLANTSATHTLISCRTGTGLGISLFYISNNFRFDTGEAGDQWGTGKFIPANEWHHVAVTKDATTKKLYIDGTLVASKSSTTTLTNLGTYVTIGCSNSNGSSIGNYFNGSMNDVRYYPIALNEDDIKELYQTRYQVDNAGNFYCNELIENDSEGTNLLNTFIQAGARTTKVDDTMIKVGTGTDVGDTYFYLQSSVALTAGMVCTFSCYATNVPEGCNWTFYGNNSSASQFAFNINKNGRIYSTFTLGQDIAANTNYLIDDVSNRPTSPPNIILCDFRLEKGNTIPDDSPSFGANGNAQSLEFIENNNDKFRIGEKYVAANSLYEK